MSVSPVCPRCGEQLVVRPGSTAQAWCHLHGAVTPLHHTVLLAHDAIVRRHRRRPRARLGARPHAGRLVGHRAWPGAASRARGRSSSTAPAPRRWAARPSCVLVAEEPGTGVGCGYAGLPGLDPGDVIEGPSSVDVKAAGQRAPLWAVPTSDDRAAFVGEAYGVWLWLVMWPMNAAWLLAEQLELIDLRDRIYPDLPLGPPSEHLLPGQLNRNPTGSAHGRRVADAATGTCVTHGTKPSAAPGWTLSAAAPERTGACPHERTPEVAVNLKKVVAWLVVAFVVFYVIQAPEPSAQIVQNAGEALGQRRVLASRPSSARSSEPT